MQLGLFQLSLGILGVLILGRLNHLLIQDIHLPAVFCPADGFFAWCRFNDAPLDVVGSSNTVKTRFSAVMEMSVD